jgi:hypothetical protein
MLVAGKPTPFQILEHVMGITPLYAMVEFNILNHPWPLPERAAAPTPREQFEAQALVLAAKHYRYAQSDMAMITLFERRTDGTYACDWVDGAWIGYQAGRESVVVQMPDAHSYTVPDVAGAAILDCMTAIRKAGGEAKL